MVITLQGQDSFDRGFEAGKRIKDKQLATLKKQNTELRAALEMIEDRLGFHEGSEKALTASGRKMVVINAQGDDGDFQEMLAKARKALGVI